MKMLWIGFFYLTFKSTEDAVYTIGRSQFQFTINKEVNVQTFSHSTSVAYV